MDYSDHHYHILVISSTEKFLQSVLSLLNANVDGVITTADSIDVASQYIKNQQFELILINYPVSDHSGLDFATRCVQKSNAVTVVIARAELQTELYAELKDQGVYILPKPLSAQTFVQALRWMLAMSHRLKSVNQGTITLEQKMDEIRLINRAKWALIDHLKMSEADAHYYIEKQAMNRCVTKTAVAESILHAYN